MDDALQRDPMPDLTPFETLLIARLDAQDTTANRNFDLLVAGMKSHNDKFDAHVKEDVVQFEAIANRDAEAKGSAKTMAKVWVW